MSRCPHAAVLPDQLVPAGIRPATRGTVVVAAAKSFAVSLEVPFDGRRFGVGEQLGEARLIRVINRPVGSSQRFKPPQPTFTQLGA